MYNDYCCRLRILISIGVCISPVPAERNNKKNSRMIRWVFSFIHFVSSLSFHVISSHYISSIQKKKWNFHLTMTDEQKISKKEKIDAAAMVTIILSRERELSFFVPTILIDLSQEQPPPGIFGKVKYYLKRLVIRLNLVLVYSILHLWISPQILVHRHSRPHCFVHQLVHRIVCTRSQVR